VLLASAPTAIETGVIAEVPFSVRVLASDGVTPLGGVAVQFSVDAAAAVLGVCGGAANCVATSDDNGLVSTTITGAVAGPVSITATEVSGGAQVTVVIADTTPVRAVQFLSDTVYVEAGANDTWTLQLQTLQDGSPLSGAATTWAAGDGLTLGSETAVSGTAGISMAIVSGSARAGSIATVTG